MIKKAGYVGLFGSMVAVIGVITLRRELPVGPIILGCALIPLVGIVFSRNTLRRSIPDLIFGAVDTGLLTIPALWGGAVFGIAGAIAGGVIGDALTDGIAGFFEGSVATWLRKKGIEESREPVSTALGKMAGCLLGAGLVLTGALMFGVKVRSL